MGLPLVQKLLFPSFSLYLVPQVDHTWTLSILADQPCTSTNTHSLYSFSYPSLGCRCSQLDEPWTEVSVIVGRLIKSQEV